MAARAAYRFLTTMLSLVADTLLVFLAASLNRPLQPVLDSFAARTGTVIVRENGASLEHVRKITELHRVPDLLLLADADVFSVRQPDGTYDVIVETRDEWFGRA